MNHSTLRHRGFTLWQVVLVLTGLGFLAAILFPFFERPRESGGPRNICQSNLKHILLGIEQYVQDYDEKYPYAAASKADFGWAGVLQPYMKSTQIFQCPQEKTPPTQNPRDPSQPQYTDYWFNARLAGLRKERVENQSITITLGDGNDGNGPNNARYHLYSIPGAWLSDVHSPLHRHDDSANFAFADGHVKRIKFDLWKSDLDTASGYTLRLKPTH